MIAVSLSKKIALVMWAVLLLPQVQMHTLTLYFSLFMIIDYKLINKVTILCSFTLPITNDKDLLLTVIVKVTNIKNSYRHTRTLTLIVLVTKCLNLWMTTYLETNTDLTRSRAGVLKGRSHL